MTTLNNNQKLQMQNDQQTAIQNGYNKANYQSGWGIGDTSNITGGFGRFNDSNALRNEIGRIETVMGNRSQYGLGNDQFNSYYDKLKTAYQPFTDAKNKATNAQNAFDQRLSSSTDTYNQAFNNFNNQITAANDSYKQGAGYNGYLDSMNQTVDSIAAKYGFTFNRDTARQQAEAEAQALRDANADAGRKNESANKTNTAAIDANLMNMAEALDRNYFQKMMGQQQNQVNSGLNAGIASDQDLRLQMSRQAEMGSAYRDANIGKMSEQERFTNEQLRLADALGTINQQAIANGNKGAQDWEMQMYDVISNDRNFYKGAADMEWGQSQDLVNQYLAQQDRLTSNFQADRNFDYGMLRDTIGDSQWDRNFAQGQFETAQAKANLDRQFNYAKAQDTLAANQWSQQFDWTKAMDEAGLTGNYNGGRTLAGTASDLNQSQFDWNKQMDTANLNYNYATLDQRKAEFATEQSWRQYEFNNMSASQQATMAQNASQFGEEMAWRMYETEYNGNLQREMAKAELDAYTRGNSSSSNNPTNFNNVKGSSSYVDPQEATKKSIDYYLNNFRVSSGYGARGGKTHYGTDFAGKTAGAAMGKEIPSIVGGTVSKIFNNHKTAGNGVWIKGADGRQYEYIHMKDKPTLKVGDKVQAGQLIGLIGSTGTSTGPHLDLKIREGGKYIDPYKYLTSQRG